jgi:hypothetical protein
MSFGLRDHELEESAPIDQHESWLAWSILLVLSECGMPPYNEMAREELKQAGFGQPRRDRTGLSVVKSTYFRNTIFILLLH